MTDFSQVELRVCASLPKPSQIYGTKKEEIGELVSHDQLVRLTLNFVKTYPDLYIGNLRKVKARYMLEALRHGAYEGGNHLITCYGNIFHFFYRGTVIYKWDAVNNQGGEVDAGEYEGTASTRNQRKEIKSAIENFASVILKL